MTAGTVYNFDQEDMVKGSGYITSQCCGSTEIELGTVYAVEMGISLFSEINRYTLMDVKAEMFYHLQVAGGSYETIPMGVFEISEANRKAKCLEIKAYDYMVRFEKAFTSLESIGNAYDLQVHFQLFGFHYKVHGGQFHKSKDADLGVLRVGSG